MWHCINLVGRSLEMPSKISIKYIVCTVHTNCFSILEATGCPHLLAKIIMTHTIFKKFKKQIAIKMTGIFI